MKNKILFTLLCSLLCYANAHATGDPVDEGNTIFAAQCSGCHDIRTQLVGPALADVDKRRNVDWIIRFVKSSQAVIKNNDKDAVELFNRFNHTVMPDHPDMSDAQIKNILTYIKTQASGPDMIGQVRLRKPAVENPGYQPLTIQKDYPIFLIYLGLTVPALIGLLYLVKFKEMERTPKKKTAE